MADHDAPAMDYDAHRSTYQSFVFMAKWGTIGVAVVLIGMAIFLL